MGPDYKLWSYQHNGQAEYLARREMNSQTANISFTMWNSMRVKLLMKINTYIYNIEKKYEGL